MRYVVLYIVADLDDGHHEAVYTVGVRTGLDYTILRARIRPLGERRCGFARSGDGICCSRCPQCGHILERRVSL